MRSSRSAESVASAEMAWSISVSFKAPREVPGPYRHLGWRHTVRNCTVFCGGSVSHARCLHRLKPDPQAGGELRFGHSIAAKARLIRRSAEKPLPDHADVRRELSPEFISYAQTGFEIGEARAQMARGIGFAVEVR